MITGAQIRAARAMLGWSQADLFEASGVSAITIYKIESKTTHPLADTLDKIERAFAEAGVLFLEPGVNRDGGAGVRMKEK